MNNANCVRGIITLTLLFALSLTASSADDYYTEPQLYGMRPSPTHEWDLGPIGVTGIRARIYKGVKVTVESTDPGSPADGKLQKGDIIRGVNGEKLEGRNPLPILGQALTAAEGADGILDFDVQPQSGDLKVVRIKIPVLGAYAKTFPLDCKKSDKIVEDAAKFYAGKDRLKSYNMWSALACLYLMGTGDNACLPRVREYFGQFLRSNGDVDRLSEDDMKNEDVQGIGQHTWFNGYNGVACAEYYLRTGDKSVLPILQYLCNDARDRQQYGLGWGHWGIDTNPAYESGGGMQHAAGTQMLLTLVLGKICGVEVDEKTLQGALKHWYRFAGHGAVPISDQRYWHIFRSAGRDGGMAAIMHAASLADGDVSVYTKARDYLALQSLTSWPANDYDWEIYWQSLSGPFVKAFDPELYSTTMKRFQWQYDLARNAAGGFEWSQNSGSEDATESGICLALAYVAPRKQLCITGAPRSKYAVKFDMPERLWGTKADLAFLDRKHNKEYYRHGKDEEIHVPYWQLPTRLRYAPGDVQMLPLETMLKNVRHSRCEVRMAAAKSLLFTGHLDELEKLMVNKDPRMRRAGLDGINDCRPWFTSLPVGQEALAADKYTPAMREAIKKMMNDPDESWFVVDGALQALAHAPVDFIEENIVKIIPWTAHEDWWLRESAFMALMGLRRDEVLFVKYLPIILKVMTKEYHYNPRHKMLKELEKVLVNSKEDGEVRRLIAAGFANAAMESEILPNLGKYPRSKEGAMNVTEVVQACMEYAPESSADLADSLARSGRLGMFETDILLKLLGGYNDDESHAQQGFYPMIGSLPEEAGKRLSETLFNAFRPELIKRMDGANDGTKVRLLNLLVKLAGLKKDVVGWHAIGEPAPADRTWRFRDYDAPEDEQMHPRIGAPKRLRDTTLPQDMENWQAVDFDDSDWRAGAAPVGKGVYIAGGHGREYSSAPDRVFENKSDWGEGEFMVMRTTFELTEDDLKNDYYRLRVLAPEGFDVYLNGKKIHTYIWFNSSPEYRQILLGPDEIKLLRKGSNVLAARGLVRFQKDKEKEGVYHAIGQLDLYIDGLNKSELGL